MRGLLIDTSLRTSLAALADGDQVIIQVRRQGRHGHSATILRDVEALLEQAGWGYEDLDFIGVGIGPGSFTGVRVGVATAKGIALSLGTPAIGVPTMDAIGACLPLETPAIVMIDAGRGRVYLGRYPEGTRKRDGDIRIIAMDRLVDALPAKNVLVAGPALSKYGDRIKTALAGRHDCLMGAFDGLTAEGFLTAALGVREKEAPDIENLTPLYLQDPAARKRNAD